MKKLYTFLTACVVGFSFSSCNDFLDYTPTAVIDEETLLLNPKKWLQQLMPC